MKKIKILNKGFTLLELLVVVLIIGILAGIALPQYKLAVLKSRYTTVMNFAKAVKDSEERYYMIHGDYTTRFADLDVDCGDRAANDNYCRMPWGYFSLTYLNHGIAFHLYKPGITYELYFDNARNYAGKIYCATGIYGQNTNNLANRVCQSLTGKTTPVNYINKNGYRF